MNSAKEVLADARSLACSQDSEARNRTALYRLYYAAYHPMLATDHGQAFTADSAAGTGLHKQFLAHLKQTSNTKTLQARALLLNLYTLRILADYSLSTRITAQMVTEADAKAAKLFHDVLGDER